jgi:sugar lactone lactonase YvrE
MQAEHFLSVQAVLGEGPVWHTGEKALYSLDIINSKVFRYTPAQNKMETFSPPAQISALAFCARGGVITAGGKGFCWWDLQNNTMETIFNPEPGKPGARFNDGKTDRKGRFWAGTMTSSDASSSLYCLDLQRQVHTMESNITISNGLGWSPDNHTMYYADSLRYVIYAYDFDLESGAITNRRPFFNSDTTFGIPDGLTIDSEGCLWSAFWGGWKIARFDPQGKLMEVVPMPVEQPSSLTFGGENLDELYVTSAQSDLSQAALSSQALAGDIFIIHPGVRGLPEPLFQG